MKKFIIMCLIVPLFFTRISGAFAQDVVTIQPQHDTYNTCAFNVTFSNHNAASQSIDEIKLDISNATITYYDFTTPAHWTGSIDGTGTSVDATADNGGIAPNGTLGGFIVSYIGGPEQYDNPVTITWTTRNSGHDISTGTLSPTCTIFQQFTKLDTVTAIPSQSGGDPLFTFTMRNRNLQGGSGGSTTDIYNVSFQLLDVTAGTLRPSKISPASGWVLDSASGTTAYFHTDNNPIIAGTSLGGWTVGLRANTSRTKFNFVWTAADISNSLIDRDTVLNVSNTATSAATEADSMSVKTVSGCLYNVTLKNFHLSNQLPPSRIVKLVLKSNTAGVTFTAAPNLPQHWTKTITNDSIVFLADSLPFGIPDGIVSTNQFSFSVAGPTTSNFVIGWETDKAGSPFPAKVSLISSGAVTTKCTVSTPATDSLLNASTAAECSYQATLKNVHNIKPQSNLTSLVLSIPSSAGTLNGSSGPAGWGWTNPGATITCKPSTSSDNMVSGSVQDFFYSFTPKTSGANVTVTWTTTDDQSQTTGTGTFTINCTQSVSLCDTLVQVASVNDDSCIKSFKFTNRKSVGVSQVSITSTNGWTIESSDTPSGWTKQTVGSNQVNYTSTDNLPAGGQQTFQVQFANFYPDTATVIPSNSFFVNWTSSDINSAQCHDSLVVTPGCVPRPFHVVINSVRAQSGDIGVENFTIAPNPTHGSADISFDLKTLEHVDIAVLDVLGNQISLVNSKLMSVGTYHIPYSMSTLPDGTYYIRMQTRLGVITRKVVLTK